MKGLVVNRLNLFLRALTSVTIKLPTLIWRSFTKSCFSQEAPRISNRTCSLRTCWPTWHHVVRVCDPGSGSSLILSCVLLLLSLSHTGFFKKMCFVMVVWSFCSCSRAVQWVRRTQVQALCEAASVLLKCPLSKIQACLCSWSCTLTTETLRDKKEDFSTVVHYKIVYSEVPYTETLIEEKWLNSYSILYWK